MGKIYTEDVGTKIRLNVGTDISSATSVSILYQNQNTNGEFPATVVDNNYVEGINPKAWAVTGEWKFQAKVELPDWQGFGETHSLTVYLRFT